VIRMTVTAMNHRDLTLSGPFYTAMKVISVNFICFGSNPLRNSYSKYPLNIK